MGTFTIDQSQFRSKIGNISLDPRMMAIMQTAATMSPYNVVAVSGVRNFNPKLPTTNHPGGYAMDVRLVDPTTGKAVPNYQNGPAYAAYETFAQTARVVQSQLYPALNQDFRWGGYFNSKTGPTGYGAIDLMHFDINPVMRGATGLGSWATGGATSIIDKYYPGAISNGGLGANPAFSAGIVAQMGANPVPPADIPIPRAEPIPLSQQATNLGGAGFVDDGSGSPQGYNVVTDAQRTAMDALPDVSTWDAATRLAFDPTYDATDTGNTGATGPYGLSQTYGMPMDAGYDPATGNTYPYGTAGVLDNMDPHPDLSGIDQFYDRGSTTPGPALQQVQSMVAGVTAQQQITEAQRLAILAVPSESEGAPPVPQADPRNVPVTPLDMPAGLRPNTIPSTTDPTAPAKQYVTSKNGHVYEVGSILKSGKDYYKVQPDGTFLKADTMPIGTGTVAEGVATGLLDNALKQAPGVLSQAGGALSGALGALGGLFSGGSTPYGGNPVPPMDVPVDGSIAWAQQAITAMKGQVAAGPSTTPAIAQAGLDNWMNNGTPTTTVLPTSPTWNSLVGGAAINAGQAATRAAAIPTWQDFMGGNTSPSSILVSPPPVSSSIGAGPSWSDIASGSGSSSPSSKADSWSQPYLDANIPSITAAPSNAASESFAKAATLQDLSADSISGVKVPEYITISKKEQVPYDKPIESGSDGVSWDPNASSVLSDGGSFSLDQMTPAPVQTQTAVRTVNKLVTIKNPAYVAQQTSLQAAPQQEFVSAGSGQQLFPQTVQQFDASTNRFNAVTVYKPAAPTPEQQAAQLAQVQSVVSGQAGNTFASAGNNNASAAAQQSSGGSLTGGSGPSGGSGNGRWA